jgi:PTH1 family peptidyl-tRNA hydrolase
MYIIVGLGNPGEEYAKTRHNTGRIVLGKFVKENTEGEMEFSKKYKALVSEGKSKKEKFTVVFPETFMNKSGASVATMVKSKKAAESLVVVHDDLDLPIGKIKISFNRGTGGHRGVLSIVKALKTEGFVRIRIGISPVTPSGKTKKPVGEKAVEHHILGKFSAKEEETLKKINKEVAEALAVLITEGRESAMSKFN